MGFAIGLVVGILVGLVVGIIWATRWYSKRLKRISPEMPRFSAPELVVYHPGNYPTPLWCTPHTACDPSTPLLEGDRFWAWGVTNHPDGKFVIVCETCYKAGVPVA